MPSMPENRNRSEQFVAYVTRLATEVLSVPTQQRADQLRAFIESGNIDDFLRPGSFEVIAGNVHRPQLVKLMGDEITEVDRRVLLQPIVTLLFESDLRLAESQLAVAQEDLSKYQRSNKRNRFGGPMATPVCFGCGYGLPVTSPQASALNPTRETDIFGVCWECGVLGCPRHAERDAGSGKWMCFSGIARAVLVSANHAQLADRDGPAFESVEDFERRVPNLAQATADRRVLFLSDRQSILAEMRTSNDSDPELLAAAAGIGDFMLSSIEPNALVASGAEMQAVAYNTAYLGLPLDIVRALGY